MPQSGHKLVGLISPTNDKKIILKDFSVTLVGLPYFLKI